MPFTTPHPYNAAAIQLTVDRSVTGFGPVRRLQSSPVVACALGLILLVPVTTFALELGEASVKSGLGQSLLVEIPYRLAADERLASACVGLAPPTPAAAGLPTYARVSRISVTATHIEIYDDKSVREPLIGLNVDVHCSTAPHFVRSYQLFVDPPAQAPTIFSNGVEVADARQRAAIDAAPPAAARQPEAAPRIPAATAAAAATSNPTASVPVTRTARATTSLRARGHAGGNVTQGQTYRVVRGDTLSGIAARIAERPATIGQTAEAIFAANPKAFTRGNRNLIEEGRSITIPIMTPATAGLSAVATPIPLSVARDANLPASAPVPTVNPAPTPTSATEPLPVENAASVVAPVAIEPLPAAATAAEPSAAPVPAATVAEVAPDAPSVTTTGRSSAWLVALLAVGVVALLSAPFVFVRRRKQQTADQARGKAQITRPRQPLAPVGGIDVVEGRPAPASSGDKTASIARPRVAPAASSDPIFLTDLNEVALTIGPTDSVDLDVGAPIVMNEGVDWFAERASAAAVAAAGVDAATTEEGAATVRMPDLDTAATVRQPSPQSKIDPAEPTTDDEMTMTIVELDMLRQDYETERTLTQQTSQALRDAVADLEATKKLRAATAETSTLEIPQQLQDETTDSATSAQTARVRAK
jgi:Tfp pilus assembly protein FimV